MKLLLIETSPNGRNSASRAAASGLLEALKPKSIVRRDLSREPLPHITAVEVEAFYTPPESRTEKHKQVLAKSDELVDELLEADALVIATPMWNYGPPSVLKAWIDHIMRGGRTFAFTAEGPKALLPAGKKVYLVLSSGSVFSAGPHAGLDALVAGLRNPLSVIGLSDIKVIRVEGTKSNDPVSREAAVSKALASLDELLGKGES